MSEKRFRVAFSFAGEKRDFVRHTAGILADRFGQEKILYDKYHEAEFANADLAFDLPALYKNEAELIVTVFCPEYENKEWCGLEWRAIYSMIKEGDSKQVMLARFRHSEGRGLYGLPGFVELDHKTPDETATLILERLAKNEGRPRDYYLQTADSENPGESKVEDSFFNVPYNSKGSEYVGRHGKPQEIWELLNNEGCAAIGQAVSVKGFGGLGKTQLAVEYAHGYKNNYRNGVFWLVADQPIDQQLLQIADAKGWVNQFDKTVNQLDIAKAKFLELSKCLVIFDNVESEDAIRSYVPKMNRDVHILITSREKQSSFRQIDLELLDRNESRELLLKISRCTPGTQAEESNLESILDILGDIPLAIELVGGYLGEHPTVSFSDYHQYLRDVPLDKLEREFPDGSFTHHDRSIIQTLRIGEKTIREKPLMVEILNVLAWSGSSAMGMSLLATLVQPEDDFAFRTALGDAFKLRLLRKDDNEDRYAIHRLLARVIRHQTPIESRREWSESLIAQLRKWFDSRKEEFTHLAEFESELEHLTEWQKHASQCLSQLSIWLTTLEAYPHWQRGNYRTSLEFLKKSVSDYARENLDDRELLANIQNDLGVIEDELGRHKKALEYKEKAVRIREELFGHNHPATASSYNNVGTSLGYLGENDKALEFKEKALRIRKEIFGEQHPDTVMSYLNVAASYGSLGNIEKQLQYSQKGLELSKKLFGEKHPQTAHAYDSVGWGYSKLGNPTNALMSNRTALDIRQELFGDEHPDTALSYNNIGTTYGELRDRKKEQEFLEKALQISRRLLSPNHPRVVFYCRNLIVSLVNGGSPEKAGRLAAEFLSYVPPDSPHWPTFHKYGSSYRKTRSGKKPRVKR